MKAISYAVAVALVGGVTSANNEDPAEKPLPSTEKSIAEEVALEDGETEGLIPSAYTTLFKNQNTEMVWGGRMYLDAGFFTADSSYVDDNSGIGGDGAEFRTARLFVKGTIYDSVEFKLQNEFDPNRENNLKDAFIAMTTPVGKIKVGHFKEPFSIEQLTSSRFITFMERSLGDVFAPSRNIGLQVSGYDEEFGDLNWAAGVFRNSIDGGPAIGEGQYSYTGRLTATAFNEEDSSSVLHYGGAISFRSDRRGRNTLTDEPEIHLLLPLGGFLFQPSSGAMMYNLEAAWVDGPVSLQGEYFASTTEATGQDIEGTGYYVMGSYFLTGEKRNYQAKGGKFARVQVRDNYDGGGGSGAVELKGRISSRDFDAAAAVLPTAFPGNELTNYSLGLNWYLNPNTRIMFDYIHSEYESGATDDSLDGIMVRFQVDF